MRDKKKGGYALGTGGKKKMVGWGGGFSREIAEGGSREKQRIKKQKKKMRGGRGNANCRACSPIRAKRAEKKRGDLP